MLLVLLVVAGAGVPTWHGGRNRGGRIYLIDDKDKLGDF